MFTPKKLVFLFSALALAAVPALSPAQVSVSITGPTPINQCEANAYRITVSNPASAPGNIGQIVVADTMPPVGFVYLPGSSTITPPPPAAPNARPTRIVAGKARRPYGEWTRPITAITTRNARE